MNTIRVNGKQYKAKEFDINLMCDLEDMGISLEDIGKKNMNMIRSYFALCADIDKETAGKEIQQHLINGGKFDEIVAIIKKEIEESDFFQALGETEETDSAKSETETTAQTA